MTTEGQVGENRALLDVGQAQLMARQAGFAGYREVSALKDIEGVQVLLRDVALQARVWVAEDLGRGRSRIKNPLRLGLDNIDFLGLKKRELEKQRKVCCDHDDTQLPTASREAIKEQRR